ncbi:MAG: hypothetical protein EXR67_00265 [Dehalococcoidia bacterium]|nr:hypothetical protein [Dehalococcoidia bacterium]
MDALDRAFDYLAPDFPYHRSIEKFEHRPVWLRPQTAPKKKAARPSGEARVLRGSETWYGQTLDEWKEQTLRTA